MLSSGNLSIDSTVHNADNDGSFSTIRMYIDAFMIALILLNCSAVSALISAAALVCRYSTLRQNAMRSLIKKDSITITIRIAQSTARRTGNALNVQIRN